MIENRKISILGCGWLGLPLAKTLIEKGFAVKGSTTSASKLSKLRDNGIEAFQLELLENEIIGYTAGFLEAADFLIVDIPPGLRGEKNRLDSAQNDKKKEFVAKIKLLITEIEKSKVKKVLFVSSTSVYGDVSLENTSLEVTEETLPNPDSESGKQLVEVEKLLLENANFETTILRFGGLIGEDRHPVNYLAGKENVANPDAPINFIHQTDCIGIITTIVEKGLRQAQSDSRNNKESLKQNQKNKGLRQAQSDTKINNAVLIGNQSDTNKLVKQVPHENVIFNAVAPEHPTRKEYYHKIAKNRQLTLPKFASDSNQMGKIVSSEKVVSVLQYQFIKEL